MTSRRLIPCTVLRVSGSEPCVLMRCTVCRVGLGVIVFPAVLAVWQAVSTFAVGSTNMSISCHSVSQFRKVLLLSLLHIFCNYLIQLVWSKCFPGHRTLLFSIPRVHLYLSFVSYVVPVSVSNEWIRIFFNYLFIEWKCTSVKLTPSTHKKENKFIVHAVL
jgi:hypothetical protein